MQFPLSQFSILDPSAESILRASRRLSSPSPFTPRDLLNHLIRPRQHVGWNRQSDLLRGLEVDDQLKFLGLLHREIGRLASLQDFVHVSGDAPIQVNIASAIGHTPTKFRILCRVKYRWKLALY